MSSRRSIFRYRLMCSLQALALPAENELSLYSEFVCKTDELALDFDAWLPCFRVHPMELTDHQIDLLESIALELGGMSGRDHTDLWTEEALRTNSRWEKVRRMSKEALAAFGWKLEPPPSDRDVYIRG